MRTKVVLGPFEGPLTSVDVTAIPESRAADELNVRTEDGTLRPRYGVSQLRAPQAGFVQGYGYEYLEGFSPANIQESEFISFENLGPAVRPYHRLPGESSVPVEIMNGGASVSLHASIWRATSWQDLAYLFNPDDTVGVYRYNIGNYTTLTPLNKTTTPTAPLTYKITYGGGNTKYATRDFTGVDVTADIAYSGHAHATDSAVNDDGSITIGHTQTKGLSGFIIKLDGATGPGKQDWRENDIFAFQLDVGAQNGVFQIDPSSVQVSLLNDSPVELIPTSVKLRVISLANPKADLYAYKVEFYDKDRPSFQHIENIAISYNVVHFDTTVGNTNNVLTMTPWVVGGIRLLPDGTDQRLEQTLEFGYTYTDANGETGIGGVLDIPFRVLYGYDPYSQLAGDDPSFGPLGVHLRLTATTSAVTSWTLYLLDQTASPSVWMQVANTAIATLTYDYDLTYAEVLRLPIFNPRQFNSIGVVDAFPFKGWMIWLYKGGFHNIRMSAVGIPERQQSDLDQVVGGPNGQGDETRGASYSMADNFGDQPLAGFQCGDAAMYAGQIGIYAQVGDAPFAMTASKKLPGSFGCPGADACCKWRDEYGNPGIVALSSKGEGVYFYAVDQSFDGNKQGFKVTELSKHVRPSIRNFLMTGQGLSDFSAAVLQIDGETDALWVMMGKRAMVLRRPNVLTQERHWEFYEYNLNGATIGFAPFSQRWGARWFTSAGAVQIVDRTIAGAPITGANRDAGNAMPAPFWKSKVITSEFVGRIDVIDVLRDDLTNTPTIQIVSTRQTSSRTLASGKRKTRFGALQSGTEHQVKISMNENDSPIHRVAIDVTGPMGRRATS